MDTHKINCNNWESIYTLSYKCLRTLIYFDIREIFLFQEICTEYNKYYFYINIDETNGKINLNSLIKHGHL